jgi:hypothetical protein
VSAQTNTRDRVTNTDTSYLSQLPQVERDSILLTVSKAALLRYGPGYYKDTHQTVIKDLGRYSQEIHKDYNDLRLYKITYIYDKRVEQLELDYAAAVYVRSDNAKVVEIEYGCGWGDSGLDRVPDDAEIIPMKYVQKKFGDAHTVQHPTRYWDVGFSGDTLWYRLNDAGKMVRTDREGNDINVSVGDSFRNDWDTQLP